MLCPWKKIQSFGIICNVLNNFSDLKFINIPARNPNDHKITMIWLPGLGYSMEKFRKALKKNTLQFDFLQQTDVYILDPPKTKITLPMFKNKTLPAWYDVLEGGPGIETVHNEYQVFDNLNKISSFIKNLYEADQSKQFFLAGFSQGCPMALHLGQLHHNIFKAIFGMSGYLFEWTKITQNQPQIYLYHGKEDNVIEEEKARKSYQRLLTKNYKVLDKVGHAIAPQAIQEINKLVLQLSKQ